MPPDPAPPVVVKPAPPPDTFRMDTEWSDEPFEWDYKAGARSSKWSRLIWNKRDLFVNYRGGKVLGFFSTIARSEYNKLLAAGHTEHCIRTHSFRLLAVIGNIISFEHESSMFGEGCNASVYSEWQFASIDLGKKGGVSYPDISENDWPAPVMRSSTRMLSLTELFDEKELLAALLANAKVAAVITENGGQTPASLKEFVKFFTDRNYMFDHVFSLERDFLLRFVFRGIENDKVKVRISLSPASHALQALQDYIEISLPLPARLRKALLAADSRKQGFLMKDAKTIAGSGCSEFEFGPAVEFPHKE
jgi:hypothetical protein